MASVLFYEKPGCINNTRQKGILESLGHTVISRNLLTEAWTAERLRTFFGQQPVAAWFNASAPRVKSGEVEPQGLSESEALELMIAEPLLIRRPLIEVGGRRMAGFEPCELLHGLGVVFEPAQDLQSCPRSHAQAACADPGAADG
jgi:nitrogenase-associated protein